ncbi:MAG: ABC transporter permease subunit, partial [Saprospiraceae bacterium]|nr:ABC transporter permease subunit [Saprospiraceae bacterium]
QVLFVFPYGLLFLSTFWNDRLKQTAFQATTLGASSWQLYRSVLIPMARPWLFICFVQCFLISWFEYGITQLIGVGKVPTLTIRTMQYVREADPHQAALASCLMVLPVLLLLVVNQRLFLKRVDPS